MEIHEVLVSKLTLHPLMSLIPEMQAEEWREFFEDVQERDIVTPLDVTSDNVVLDGRHRLKAAVELGLAYVPVRYVETDAPVAYMIKAATLRRQLTSSQLAMIAAGALPELEAEAKKRQLATLKQNQDATTVPENFPERESSGEARDQAAELFGTNARYVSDAKRIMTDAPELADQVRNGEIPMYKAKRELVRRERKEVPTMPEPEERYRVVYADPPWRYNDKGLDDYGHAERHYPTMSITELCDLGVNIRDIVAQDAVLFLWATSPLLESAFKIIAAWGFKYKTSFVWDKIGHNFGHYNSVRHELLLVCTKGSCTPDVPKLFDSVQSIQKSRTHSEKPEAFRNIIDTLYTRGNRVELFARSDAEGWDSWGNEPDLVRHTE